MTDSLKVMCIFEAGATLGCESELVCLAANIYHRFFRGKEKPQYDVFAIAAASLKLAHRFCEQPLSGRNLILAMMSIIHGRKFFLDGRTYDRLRHTICLAERIIATNLDYQLDFRYERMLTPGQLQEQYRNRAMQGIANRPKQVIVIDCDEDSSSSDDDDQPIPKADLMLAKNSKHTISAHRYLLHYLKTVQSLLKQNCQVTSESFGKICNVAWIILCDCHWSHSVTNIDAHHLACACLIMAIEICRNGLEKSRNQAKLQLWSQLNREWNLIFCDDFPNVHRDRALDSIVLQYNEYERLMQEELSMTVINRLDS